jgi:hypothetical protein
MNGADRYLGKMLRLKDGQGNDFAIGRCVSYCEVPTVHIVTAEGNEFHWRADMSEVLDITRKDARILIPPKDRLYDAKYI